MSLAACGAGEPTAAPTATVTVTALPSPPAETAPSPSPSPPPAAERIKVPNVVGRNLQYGQDKMQSVGLYNLRERDAEGLDRLMILDVNWIIVKQSPKAGKRVAENAEITLYAKKRTD